MKTTTFTCTKSAEELEKSARQRFYLLVRDLLMIR